MQARPRERNDQLVQVWVKKSVLKKLKRVTEGKFMTRSEYLRLLIEKALNRSKQ